MFKMLKKTHKDVKEQMHQASTAYLINASQPIWTDKNYTELAKSSYVNNVIAHRAMNLIAHGAASIPIKLYENINGQKHLITQHEIIDILQNPNSIQSGKEFLEAIYIYRQIAGNAFVIITYENNKYQLYTLRPDRVHLIKGNDFIPRGYRYKVDQQYYDYYIDEDGLSPILHIKNFHPLSDWYGLSSVEAAAYSIDQHNQASVWNQSLLQSGGRPSGAIIVKNSEGKPANLTEEQFYRLKSSIEQTISGPANAGKPLLLEGGLEWKEMSLSPKDMDYIKSKENSAREIALAFNVPPQLLGIPGDNTYSNLSEARIALWEQTIIPLVENTLYHFNRWLSKRFGNFELKYDLEGIPALSHRVDSLWHRIENNSFMTIDEKRAAVGLSPQ